jgi:hypothetical protein
MQTSDWHRTPRGGEPPFRHSATKSTFLSHGSGKYAPVFPTHLIQFEILEQFISLLAFISY